jgi:hypothetical protein
MPAPGEELTLLAYRGGPALSQECQRAADSAFTSRCQSFPKGGNYEEETDMRIRTAVVLSGVWVFAAACSSPTAPSSPASVAGLWTGSTDPPSRAIAHYIFFRIDQSGTSLSGTYGTTAGSGTLAGEVNGSIVSLTATHLSPRNQRCPGTFSVKAKVMLNRMGGTMTLPSDCTGRTNNIALERERRN